MLWFNRRGLGFLILKSLKLNIEPKLKGPRVAAPAIRTSDGDEKTLAARASCNGGNKARNHGAGGRARGPSGDRFGGGFDHIVQRVVNGKRSKKKGRLSEIRCPRNT